MERKTGIEFLIRCSLLSAIFTDFCHQRKRTVLSNWLQFLRQICDICIAAHGLSILLDYMNGKKPNSYIHLVPTSTMPHVMPIMVIIVIALLFILGLEASSILEALLKAFLGSAIIIFLLTSATLVSYPDNKILAIPDDPVQKVLLSSAFFWSCYPQNPKNVDLHSIFEHLLKHGLFSGTIITLLFIPKAECAMFGLICPISHWYPWFEPTMVCVAVSCLCLTLPQIFSSALNTLVISYQFKVYWFFKENPKLGTQVRAIIAIGFVSIIMVYFHSMYNLILISSSCVLLSHVFDVLLTINDQYQPLFAPKDTVYYIKLFGEKVQMKRKRRKYVTLRNKSNHGNCEVQNDDKYGLVTSDTDSGHSSDTDIDSVVAEYKESVKIKSFNFRRRTDKEPTIHTGRIVSALLCFIILQAILCSVALIFGYYAVASSTVLGVILLTAIIYWQPQQTDIKMIGALSLYKHTLLLTFEIVLIGTIILKIVLSLLLWTVGGVVFMVTLNKCRKVRKEKRQRINLQTPPGPFIIGNALPIQRNVPYDSVHA